MKKQPCREASLPTPGHSFCLRTRHASHMDCGWAISQIKIETRDHLSNSRKWGIASESAATGGNGASFLAAFFPAAPSPDFRLVPFGGMAKRSTWQGEI